MTLSCKTKMQTLSMKRTRPGSISRVESTFQAIDTFGTSVEVNPQTHLLQVPFHQYRSHNARYGGNIERLGSKAFFNHVSFQCHIKGIDM